MAESAITSKSCTNIAFFCLANELWLQIGAYIGAEPMDMGGYPYLSRKQYIAAMGDLRSMASSCKRLAPIAQEQLFRSPYLFDCEQNGCEIDSMTLYFLRSILDRPDLALKVAELRLGITGHVQCTAVGAEVTDISTVHILEQAKHVAVTTSFKNGRKTKWLNDLKAGRSGPLTGVILHLLPNLRFIHFDNSPVDYCDTFGPLFGDYRTYWSGSHMRNSWLFPPQRDETLEGLSSIQGLKNVKHLKLTTAHHPQLYGLSLLPHIKELDIALQGHGQGHQQPPHTDFKSSDFQHIEVVRIDSRIHAISLEVPVFLENLRHLLPSFTNARSVHFYAEPPDYPHQYDFGPSHFISLTAWCIYEDSLEDHRSYHALVSTLHPLYNTLESLQLPGGFWSLPTESDRPPVDLKRFPKLRHLTAPKVALLGAGAQPRHKFWYKTWNGREMLEAEWDWDLMKYEEVTDEMEPEDTGPHIPMHSPRDVLPSTLQTVRVFEADIDTCAWLEDVFRYKESDFPELRVVEMVVTKFELEEDIPGMLDLMKAMAVGPGVVVEVKLDTSEIGGPKGKAMV